MDFSLSDAARSRISMSRMAAEGLMRPIARQFDEEEHTDPWEFFNTMWEFSRGNRDATSLGGNSKKEKGGRNEGTLLACMQIEELAWGDAGLYLSIPNPGLGGAAVRPDHGRRVARPYRHAGALAAGGGRDPGQARRHAGARLGGRPLPLRPRPAVAHGRHAERRATPVLVRGRSTVHQARNR